MKLHVFHRPTMCALAAGSLVLAFGAGADEDKMQMMDANKDGVVSASEHAAGARSMFGKMDADGDGRVTAAEMDAAHKGMPGHAGTHGMSSADKIKTIDADHDGVITSSEHEKGSSSMFERMDANGDGNLSFEEMQAPPQKPMTEQPR
jgi:hypothetical protein